MQNIRERQKQELLETREGLEGDGYSGAVGLWLQEFPWTMIGVHDRIERSKDGVLEAGLSILGAGRIEFDDGSQLLLSEVVEYLAPWILAEPLADGHILAEMGDVEQFAAGTDEATIAALFQQRASMFGSLVNAEQTLFENGSQIQTILRDAVFERAQKIDEERFQLVDVFADLVDAEAVLFNPKAMSFILLVLSRQESRHQALEVLRFIVHSQELHAVLLDTTLREYLTTAQEPSLILQIVFSDEHYQENVQLLDQWRQDSAVVARLKLLENKFHYSSLSSDKAVSISVWKYLIGDPESETPNEWGIRVNSFFNVVQLLVDTHDEETSEIVNPQDAFSQLSARAEQLTAGDAHLIFDLAEVLQGGGKVDSRYLLAEDGALVEHFHVWRWLHECLYDQAGGKTWVQQCSDLRSDTEVEVRLSRQEVLSVLSFAIPIFHAQSVAELQTIVHEVVENPIAYHYFVQSQVLEIASFKAAQESWQLDGSWVPTLLESMSLPEPLVEFQRQLLQILDALQSDPLIPVTLVDATSLEQFIDNFVEKYPSIADSWMVRVVREYLKNVYFGEVTSPRIPTIVDQHTVEMREKNSRLYRLVDIKSIVKLVVSHDRKDSPYSNLRTSSLALRETLSDRPLSLGAMRLAIWVRMWAHPEDAEYLGKVFSIVMAAFSNQELDQMQASDFEYLTIYFDCQDLDQLDAITDLAEKYRQFKAWEAHIPDYLYPVEKTRNISFGVGRVFKTNKSQLVRLQLVHGEYFEFMMRAVTTAPQSALAGLESLTQLGMSYAVMKDPVVGGEPWYYDRAPRETDQSGDSPVLVMTTPPSLEETQELIQRILTSFEVKDEKAFEKQQDYTDFHTTMGTVWKQIVQTWRATGYFAHDILLKLVDRALATDMDSQEFKKTLDQFSVAASSLKDRERLEFVFTPFSGIESFQFFQMLRRLYSVGSTPVDALKPLSMVTMSELHQARDFIISFDSLVLLELYRLYLLLGDSGPLPKVAKSMGVTKTGEAGQHQLRAIVLELKLQIATGTAVLHHHNPIHVEMLSAMSRSNEAVFQVSSVADIIQKVNIERDKRILPAGVVPRVIYVDVPTDDEVQHGWQPSDKGIKIHKQLREAIFWLIGADEMRGKFPHPPETQASTWNLDPDTLKENLGWIEKRISKHIGRFLIQASEFAQRLPENRAQEAAAIKVWIKRISRILSDEYPPLSPEVYQLTPQRTIDLLSELLDAPYLLDRTEWYQEAVRFLLVVRMYEVECQRLFVDGGNQGHTVFQQLVQGEEGLFSEHASESSLRNGLELFDHLMLDVRASEIFGVTDDEGVDQKIIKRIRQMMNIKALKAELRSAASAEKQQQAGLKMEIVIIPNVYELAELVGQFSNACLAGTQIVTEKGDTFGIAFVTGLPPEIIAQFAGYQPNSQFEKVVLQNVAFQGGGVCILSQKSNGQPVLHLTGNNPLQTFLRRVMPQDFVAQLYRGFIVPTATALDRSVVIPNDGLNETSTNRADIHHAHVNSFGMNPVVTLAPQSIFPRDSYNGNLSYHSVASLTYREYSDPDSEK